MRLIISVNIWTEATDRSSWNLRSKGIIACIIPLLKKTLFADLEKIEVWYLENSNRVYRRFPIRWQKRGLGRNRWRKQKQQKRATFCPASSLSPRARCYFSAFGSDRSKKRHSLWTRGDPSHFHSWIEKKKIRRCTENFKSIKNNVHKKLFRL